MVQSLPVKCNISQARIIMISFLDVASIIAHLLLQICETKRCIRFCANCCRNYSLMVCCRVHGFMLCLYDEFKHPLETPHVSVLS